MKDFLVTTFWVLTGFAIVVAGIVAPFVAVDLLHYLGN